MKFGEGKFCYLSNFHTCITLYRHKRGAQKGNDDVNIMVDEKKILLPRQTSCISWTAFWKKKSFWEHMREREHPWNFGCELISIRWE